MTGWNLPPGCNVSDIPGNGPDDVAFEKFADTFDKKCEEFNDGFGRVDFDGLCQWVWQQNCIAYGDGYSQGMKDEEQARRWQGTIPAEASLAMMDAGVVAAQQEKPNTQGQVGYRQVRAAWDAMVKASRRDD